MRTGKHSQKLTVLTLAVALAVAVYLNWEYARTGDIAAEPDAAQTSATAEPLRGIKTMGKPSW